MKFFALAGLTTAVALLSLAGSAPVFDVGSIAADANAAEPLDEELGCPSAEWVCNTYTGGACAVSGLCEGEDCYTFARGPEIRVISLGDAEDEFTADWLARHSGSASLIGYGIACEVTPISPAFSKVEIPTTHCAAVLATNEHYYLQFFASNPASGCHGWVECQCY